MTEPTDPRNASATNYDRYRVYEADDGSLVLYDGQNDEAWLQTDTMVKPRP